MSIFVQTCQIEFTNVNVWFTSVAVTKNSPDPTRDRENIGAGGGAASPRTKKQSAGLFFAACEPPSCSSPTVTKNLAQPRRAARDFGAGDRARTGTSLTSRDFKSRASANSATPANQLLYTTTNTARRQAKTFPASLFDSVRHGQSREMLRLHKESGL